MGEIKIVPVRKASRADRDGILAMCQLNHEENGQFNLSMSKVEQMVDRAFSNSGAIIGLVGNGKIEGFILLVLSQHWYTEDWCLEEVMNFVHPDHRKSTHAKDMIQFAKRCSDEIGIPLLIGVVSNERTAAKINLYKRQLGEPCGGFFKWEPKQLFAPTPLPAAG